MGVAVGLAVTVGVAAAVGDAVTVGVAVTEVVVLGPAVAVRDAPADAVDVPCDDEGTVAVPLPTAVGADAVVVDPTDGEKIAGTEEPPPLQADTDPESRTVAAAQPTAVSLALLTCM